MADPGGSIESVGRLRFRAVVVHYFRSELSVGKLVDTIFYDSQASHTPPATPLGPCIEDRAAGSQEQKRSDSLLFAARSE